MTPTELFAHQKRYAYNRSLISLGGVVDTFTTIKSTEGYARQDIVVEGVGASWAAKGKDLTVTTLKELTFALYESITDRETGLTHVKVTIPNYVRSTNV